MLFHQFLAIWIIWVTFGKIKKSETLDISKLKSATHRTRTRDLPDQTVRIPEREPRNRIAHVSRYRLFRAISREGYLFVLHALSILSIYIKMYGLEKQCGKKHV